MEFMNSEQPDVQLGDLVGEEPYFAPVTPIPVVIQGTVMTEERASTFAGMSTSSAVDAITGARILTADPRRRYATILALTQNIRIGRNQSQALNAGAVWPANVPLVINSRDELWVSSVTSTTDVSIIVERWA
jgi:hypothetical protein